LVETGENRIRVSGGLKRLRGWNFEHRVIHGAAHLPWRRQTIKNRNQEAAEALYRGDRIAPSANLACAEQQKKRYETGGLVACG